MNEIIATSSAQVIQNSTLTSAFIVTGEAFWAVITLIGVLTVAKKAIQGFLPRKVKIK